MKKLNIEHFKEILKKLKEERESDSFSSHDFIDAYRASHEDDYRSMLGCYTENAFQKVNARIARFLSINSEKLKVKKEGKCHTKNDHGKRTSNQLWRFLLLFILALPLFGCNNVPEDPFLKGKIKSITTKFYTMQESDISKDLSNYSMLIGLMGQDYVDGNFLDYIMEEKFNKNNQVKYVEYYRSKGGCYKREEYKYSKGLLKKITILDEQKNIIKTRKISYLGRNISEDAIYGSEDNEIRKYSYYYVKDLSYWTEFRIYDKGELSLKVTQERVDEKTMKLAFYDMTGGEEELIYNAFSIKEDNYIIFACYVEEDEKRKFFSLCKKLIVGDLYMPYSINRNIEDPELFCALYNAKSHLPESEFYSFHLENFITKNNYQPMKGEGKHFNVFSFDLDFQRYRKYKHRYDKVGNWIFYESKNESDEVDVRTREIEYR